MTRRTKTKAKRGNFKSMLEKNVNDHLSKKGIPCGYETRVLTYLVPTSKHRYTPDFLPEANKNVILEVKGRLTIADRKKMLLIKEQYPELRICLVFGNAREKLYKKSKTTYGAWATKNGFEWCDFYRDGVPDEWFGEDA